MSWLPDKDPVLGDKKSCDALELIIVPRVRDLGDGFVVRRALPHGKRRMVGPFIFFDQMGPVQFMAGQGMDVRPHPHIGLATVTYLFDGRVMHRDSEGNALEITPGAMNLMTAGRGIAHSERTPVGARAGGEGLFCCICSGPVMARLGSTDPGFEGLVIEIERKFSYRTLRLLVSQLINNNIQCTTLAQLAARYSAARREIA